MALAIESWEDRSGNTDPSPNSFGYVYFNDESRVGYSPGTDGPPVWHAKTNGGGRHVETYQRHIDMATTFLKEKGVLS